VADALPPQSGPPPDFAAAYAVGDDARTPGVWSPDDEYEAPPAVKDRPWLHALLFVLTFASATFVGGGFYLNFLSDLGWRRIEVPWTTLLLGGLWYSVPALLILGCHELGHYFACRYYGVRASLPYFIPAPLVLFGTLGAVIRIRDPLRTKRVLFDVGVAGPLAGFVVLAPALIVGISWSEIMRQPPPSPGGLELGEPLLFQLVTRWFFGPIPEGYTINAHPMAFASIFGLLATALNLLPVGQLDGGHLSYANLGRRSKYVTFLSLFAALVMGVTLSTSWLVWGGLILVMLRFVGFEHPPTEDEDEPLDGKRIAVTILTIIIFALCFTPWPMTPQDLISR
jgi:membrane-associated protease RseP (regulator of RpoE activity)